MSQNAGFGLSAQTEKQNVVLGKNRVLQQRQHRAFVTDNSRPAVLAGSNLLDQILTQLCLWSSDSDSRMLSVRAVSLVVS